MKPETKILVPSGIGDGYWVIAKLRGFVERMRISNPVVYVQDGVPRRSHGMWERVPFVRFGGYAELNLKARTTRVCLTRAYQRAGYPVQRRVLGFDFFISLNGSLVGGRSLDEAMPGRLDWYEPFSRMDVTEIEAAQFQLLYGSYVVVGLWEHGFYRHWLRHFPESKIVETLTAIADGGRTVVLMGADWDRAGIAERVAAASPRFINLVGETDFDQMTGLVAGASAVFGFPAGTTLISPRFKTPTVMLWTEHFRREFWANACPPDPAFYRPLDARGADPKAVADLVLQIAKPEPPRLPITGVSPVAALLRDAG